MQTECRVHVVALFNSILFQTCPTPQDWLCSRLTLLPKVPVPCTPSELRPIVLSSTPLITILGLFARNGLTRRIPGCRVLIQGELFGRSSPCYMPMILCSLPLHMPKLPVCSSRSLLFLRSLAYSSLCVSVNSLPPLVSPTAPSMQVLSRSLWSHPSSS